MRKVCHWSLAALGALCLSGSAALPVAAAGPVYDTPLHNMAADACLNHAYGNQVTLTECELGNPTQEWAHESLGDSELLWIRATDECLGHAGGSGVRLMPCDPYDQAQWWRAEPANAGSLIRHLGTDACLGHLGGAEVQLFECDPSNPGQQWVLGES